MFYGFKAPEKNDVVFKVKGDLEKVRLFDFAAREILSGAVQSTIRDGIRYYWSEILNWTTEHFASLVQWFGRYKLLKPVAWLLTLPLFALAYISTRVKKSEFTKRRFVKDADGNYIFMSGSIPMEHSTRAIAAQLAIAIQSEKFPAGFSRNPKQPRNGTMTFSFTTVTGVSMVLDLQG